MKKLINKRNFTAAICALLFVTGMASEDSAATTNTTGQLPQQLQLNKTTGESYGAPLGQFVLAVRNFTSSDIHNYRLRMWVANDYTLENYVQTYKLRVNVYGNSSV